MRLASGKLIYQAHLKAMEYELELAMRQKNITWLRSRMKDIEAYLADKDLPKELTPRYRSILRGLTRYVSS